MNPNTSPPPPSEYDDLTPAARRRALLYPMLRSLLVTMIVFALYLTLPFDSNRLFNTGAALIIGLVAVSCLLTWQARAITRAPYPLLKAIEALITSFPIVILMFSTTYFVTDERAPGTFTQPMTRIDALYFTVTTFATVGFGDITPVAESARVITTVQILVDLVLVGLVVNVFLRSVRTGLARRGDRPGNGQ